MLIPNKEWRRVRLTLAQVSVLLKKEISIMRKSLLTTVLTTVFPVVALFLFSLPNLGSGDNQRFTGQPVYQEPLSAREALAPRRFLDSPVYPANTQVPYSDSWIPFEWSTTQQRIWWAPNTDPMVATIMRVSALMNGVNASELRDFATEAELKKAYEDAQSASFLAGVVFEPIDITANVNARYKILINGTYAPNTDPEKQEVIIDDTSQALVLDYGKYIDTGFVAIQNMVDNAIIKVFAGNSTNLTVPSLNAVQSFPRPIVQAADASWVFKWLPGWCLNISILFWFTAVVTKMVYDREYEYYRFFLIMKVSRWSYYLHWLLYFWCVSIILSLALVGILYADSVLVLSSWTLIWIHYLLFLWQLVVVAIGSSTVVRSVQSEGSVGLAFTFLISAVYIALVLGKVNDLSQLKTALSLIPWFASMRGGEIMASLDHRGQRVGLIWANAWESEFGYLLITQVCGILLFGILSAFMVMPRVFRRPLLIQKCDSGFEATERVIEDAVVEKPVVDIVDVTKVFHRQDKSVLVAVDNLSLRVEKGEILGLLGHNGAGKTTLIRMLCGELNPDGGKIDFLSAADGRVDPHPLVGVCLQQDILFPELSAKQHLQIFAGLRGCQVPSESEVDAMMRDVGLDNTGRDDRIATYSGGMKRKLSLAISLLGDPDYLLLDEPSAGMDPYSRRCIWEVILRLAHAHGKTIIMTTHFMDEADMLSDRIAIMRSGQLLALGTSLFLKYNINRLTPDDASVSGGYTITATCPSTEARSEVIRKLRAIIPTIGDSSVGEKELCVQLPVGSEKLYADALDIVNAMGSPDVAVGLTSLEDVFLATAKKDEADRSASTASDPADSTWQDPSLSTENRIWQRVDDKKPSQIRAVLHLARLTTLMEYRTPTVIVFGNILPIIFILVGFVLSYLIDPKGSLETPPSLTILPSTTTLGSTGPFYVEGDAFNPNTLGPPLQWTASLPPGGNLLARYESNGTLQFDPNVVSSLPLSISALTNSTLSLIPFPSISVSVINAPLPYVKSYLIDVTQLLVPMFTMMGFIPYAYVVIRMAFWRADRIITQMKLMGMSVRLQYTALFVQRLIFGFLPAFVIILIAAGAFGSQLLGDGGRWLAYLLLVITTFVALIPFAMMLAPLFKTGRQAGDSFPLMWNCLSIIPYIIVWILSTNSSESTRNIGEVIGNIMTIIPTLAYQRGTQKILALQFAVDRASKVVDSPVEWSDTFDPSNGILTPILVNVGVIVASTLVVWYQTRDLTSTQMKRRKKYDSSNEDLPEAADLLEEAIRAKEATQGIAVQNLTKIYPNQKKAAVKNLNIGVAPSEILVLLGPNGAGKTTTMKMLTGEEVSSAGIIKLGHNRDFEAAESGSLNFNSLYKRQVCGYCPQFDALFPELTVKEHLQLACTLKGLKTRSTMSSHRAHVDAIVVALDLETHLNTRSERLSGGNRRKLSLTLAVMGNPYVLFLDEPSTGMDPSAKRSVWKALRGEHSRPAMLMSTHYMDEATALSTRIGIMINGQMRVVGSVPELANRFSREISVEASLRPNCSASYLANELSFALGGVGVSVIEDFNRSTILRAPVAHGLAPTEQIAELFRIMEGSLKERCGVIYYNLKLMSLEQIFINLVREQRE